ncbi:DUF4150 domain-containing protein [Mesorhizobium sp. WSM4904]|uniref:DUF4150 domain-containing protein n=1 Tax=Mesorhizobium sp. WSM4904 TaxID=3038545 RepID=UPI002418A168|nr:DUF4150 domain-containing protein [Mesorhizobium sp. WSM4904]WFP62580.1 DUF4150 domain-containing protein [Mesorhizobium sp. WSM4904]
MTVFANGLEVAAKAQGNKVIAAFPDVCFTPPENPATPPGVPIPYPSFGMDSDTENGTGTVKIGGENITQKDKSDYSKTTGTEAGSAAKKGVISSTNTSKEYARAWSSNVKADGLPVSRFTDISTNNHSSDQVGNTPPQAKIGTPGPGGGSAPKTKCPCCGAEPAHANQVKANGEMCDTIPESQYYSERMQRANAKIDDIEATMTPGDPRRFKAWEQYTKRKQAHETVKNARSGGKKCPNLHEEDKDCGVHFQGTRSYSEILEQEDPDKKRELELKHAGKPNAKDLTHVDILHHVRTKILGVTDSVKNQIIKRDGKGTGQNKGKVHHMTPIDAGGCPTSPNNLIGEGALAGDCKDINEAQGTLQGINPYP